MRLDPAIRRQCEAGIRAICDHDKRLEAMHLAWFRLTCAIGDPFHVEQNDSKEEPPP